MAAESSLPIFLYRANPGTGPETINVMLSRLFRENYASAGSETLGRVAALGILVSLALLVAALLGTFVGRALIGQIRFWLSRSGRLSDGNRDGTILAWTSYLILFLSFVPGILAVIGLILPGHSAGLASNDTLRKIFSYWPIVTMGTTVGATITAAGIAIAVRLRYSKRDLLAALEKKSVIACLLLLPAFVPVLSVIAALGKMSDGQMSGFPGYLSLFISHFALHYSVFQFICMALVASIPECHVAWQRAMHLGYVFSLVTDGFKRHAAVIVSLVGLGMVQVVTDGSVSRWFSHLVGAPEEALYAAVFGRLSSAAEAVVIGWSVAIMAIMICAVLATAYVRELKSRPRYV